MSIVRLYMIKNISVLMLSLCMAMVVTSCVEDEEVQTSPECYIAGFSVDDISSEVTVKLSDGSDTVITRTISGSSIAFNVSQVKNTIEVVDSLPDWTDLTKVKPSISSTGYVFIKRVDDADFLPFANGSVEVDFTQPVSFRVVATDLVSTKTYTAKMFKRISGEQDSLMWTKRASSDLHLEGKHRTLVLENVDTLKEQNGDVRQVADRIYVFAENDGTPTVTSSSLITDVSSWSAPVPLPAGLDWQSVTAFKSVLYAHGADGRIYKASDRGTVWNAVSDKVVERLLCADSTYIYAYDGVAIVGSRDLQEWSVCGTTDLDLLPQTCVSSVWHTIKTNSSLSAVVMNGLTDNNTENAVVWYKISSADKSLNQEWNYIQVTDDNAYGCPKLDNMSMAYYNNELMAIGGAYEGIYISRDNGISWKLQTAKKNLPEQLRNNAGTPMSMVVAGGNLWLIRSGGEVWQGKM